MESRTSNSGAKVRIAYCTGCRWLLRSAWMMQELLTSFEEELESVTLIPSRPPAPGGVFVSGTITV
jgi:selenoprotein W-related protein